LRTTTIAGNWKMYKTQAESKHYLAEFYTHLTLTADHARVPLTEKTIVLCPPFTALGVLQAALPQSHHLRLYVGAQNVHWSEVGAFTGEIAPPMLVELGIRHVIVGHSERRHYFGETEATVNQRLRAAQSHGMTPILCVGETKAQRDAGQTESWILSQLTQDLDGVDAQQLIVAYEPIWAIGTGDTCEPTEANRIAQLIRQHLPTPDVTIQYGGSVKPDNIDAIMAQPEVDGVLVGGASLDPVGFARIVNYA